MHCKHFPRVTQRVGAYTLYRPVAVSAPEHFFSGPLAPLTLVRGAPCASPGASAGPVRSGRRVKMQRNGIHQKEAADYPYELQLRLFGNHLLSLAEEASQFDFRGVYTAAEVAEILQVTPSKIYDLLHTGELPSVRVGRQFRVGKFSLWAHINGLDREGLVEEILDRFVTQHCCRDGECVPKGDQR